MLRSTEFFSNDSQSKKKVVKVK